MKQKWPPNDTLAKLLRLDAKLFHGKITNAQYQERLARIRRLAAKEAAATPQSRRERTR